MIAPVPCARRRTLRIRLTVVALGVTLALASAMHVNAGLHAEPRAEPPAGPSRQAGASDTVTPSAPRIAYDSFQIRHASLTALGTLASLGWWPARYADDLHAVSVYEDGWTREQADMLRPLAEQAFRGWVKAWGAVVAVIVISALLRRVGASTRHSKEEGG